MNLEECYEKIGANYAEMLMRLPNPKLIEKFVGKFLDDDSFDNLSKQLELGNREEAFNAAHTLKGVCANLRFTRLFDSASLLTEELRNKTDSVSPNALKLYEGVRRDYETAVNAIKEYFNSNNPQ